MNHNERPNVQESPYRFFFWVFFSRGPGGGGLVVLGIEVEKLVVFYLL